jgi:periplasmic protein CpxP/Spy
MKSVFRYAAILVWGSVVLLGANQHMAHADGGHGGMMCGHMCMGHDQAKQEEHGSHDLQHLLKHGKDIGLTSEQIGKLKTMQLDLARAQARAEAEVKVAMLELHAIIEDGQVDTAAIQTKVDQLKKAEGSLLFTTIKSKRDAMALLSPDQREKERVLQEKMMGGAHQHSGGMGGMSGGGHGAGGGAGHQH